MDTYYNKGDKVKGYSILEIIGEGRYGIAYLAINDKGEKAVVKQLREEFTEGTRDKLSYEEKTLLAIDSPNIPKFITKYIDNDKEGYILEYVEGRDLYSIISDEECKFTKDEIFEVCNKILNIIGVLQRNNIVHRDIRPSNVIVSENNDLVLIDFGLARFIDEENYYVQEDYWFLADLLIHLYYTAYYTRELDEYEEKYNEHEDVIPWYEELDISDEEKHFLKKLMGIEGEYDTLDDVRKALEKVKNKQKGELYV